ncbi:hypothetical protein K505DRAFT_342656 [Melanomma pulvis-pyrius CBS 109.77]|uniref:RING-type domain-containing protein n=1 Tax=Melanomma pulvis-pyrius CBS 109.77 TaxID=1314802 RepID=A0A6A6WUJ5_9PLEO|nr:hypothetical protein K505DRAFT_342656 [Melanomma pulvis-pyrius CBS 109.77]
MPSQEGEPSVTEGTRPSRRQAFLNEGVDVLDPQNLDPADTECPICRETYPRVSNSSEQVVQIHLCQHIFHDKCLNTWLETTHDLNIGTCPMCRTVLYSEPSIPVPSLDMAEDPPEDIRESGEYLMLLVQAIWDNMLEHELPSLEELRRIYEE